MPDSDQNKPDESVDWGATQRGRGPGRGAGRGAGPPGPRSPEASGDGEPRSPRHGPNPEGDESKGTGTIGRGASEPRTIGPGRSEPPPGDEDSTFAADVTRRAEAQRKRMRIRRRARRQRNHAQERRRQ